MKVVIVGASSLLGHHILAALANDSVHVIAFLPEDEALWFVQHYPGAKFSFCPYEPTTPEAVQQFFKVNQGIDHVIVLGPHQPPTQQDLSECDRQYNFTSWSDDPTSAGARRDAFHGAKRRTHIWQVETERDARTCILQSSLNSCDANDAVFSQPWKRFTDRDICLVTYTDAIKNVQTAARYTDAMVEHHFYHNCRSTYNIAVVLCVAELTGPGLFGKYREHESLKNGGAALFVDVRDAARAFRAALGRLDTSRNLVATGPWDEQVFARVASEYKFEHTSKKWGCQCNTHDFQKELGYEFRPFEQSLRDTFEWLQAADLGAQVEDKLCL